MHRPRCQWHGDPQAPAKITDWQYLVFRRIDFGANLRRMFPKYNPGLRQCGTAGRSRKKLDTQGVLKPEKAATDH